jgi:hypothetical protein
MLSESWYGGYQLATVWRAVGHGGYQVSSVGNVRVEGHGGGASKELEYYRKKEQQSPPRFKHIGRGLLSAGRAASCLDGDCATRDAALMAHQMRGARLHDWVVVDMLTVLPGVGHRLDAETSFTISRRAC